MGRKTFNSIGRALPNRINVVLSAKKYSDQQGVYFAGSTSSALYLADLLSVLNGYDEIFVIGGGTIYKEFPYNKIHLTEVYAPEVEGDTFFDEKFDMRSWRLEQLKEFPRSETDEYPFAIRVLKKRDETTHRYRTRHLARFFTPDENLSEWESKQLSSLKLPRASKQIPLEAAVQLEFPALKKQIVA
jgi:dihydrofolate reductase